MIIALSLIVIHILSFEKQRNEKNKTKHLSNYQNIEVEMDFDGMLCRTIIACIGLRGPASYRPGFRGAHICLDASRFLSSTEAMQCFTTYSYALYPGSVPRTRVCKAQGFGGPSQAVQTITAQIKLIYYTFCSSAVDPFFTSEKRVLDEGFVFKYQKTKSSCSLKINGMFFSAV